MDGVGEGMNRIVSVSVNLVKEPSYPVLAYGMWMLFENRHAYLDWCNGL